jgi:protein TonB
VPQYLFGDVLVRSRRDSAAGSRRSSIVFSLAAHGVVVVALLVAPLLATDTLPIPQRAIDFILDRNVIPAVPEPPRHFASRPHRGPSVLPGAPDSLPPAVAPNGIAPENEDAAGSGRMSGPPQIGTIEGIQAANVGPIEAPPPPPVVPVRLHSGIRTPQKLVDVAPIYPAAARAARIHGLVVLEATIDVHGNVDAIRVLRSPPFLGQAAVDAVRQWKFTPTLLNGVPVPVIMAVTVNFELQ